MICYWSYLIASWRSARLLLTLIGTMGADAAHGATIVFHCTKDGRVVLTDKPCDATGAKASTTLDPARDSSIPNVSAGATVVGEWRGQTQFQGTENGQLIADAHSVEVLAVTFSEDGKVVGSSPENGCKMLGIWVAGATPRLFPLDVTLSGCRYAGFNRRYSGNFIATFEKLSGQLFLQAYTVPIPGVPVRRYDLGATLRR